MENAILQKTNSKISMISYKMRPLHDMLEAIY